MLRRSLFAALAAVATLVAGAAQAAEAPAKKAPEQFVDLKPVGMPIVVDGRLVNYIFVLVRVNLTPRTDAEQWRQKEPEFRDLLVRAGYRTPFVVPGDYQKLDAAKLSASLMHEGAAMTGPGVIQSVIVLSQTPSRRASAAR